MKTHLHLISASAIARLGLILSSTLIICACSSLPRGLEKGESLLDTGGPITVQYHSSLYYPNEIALRHDGFIVGIEKSPNDIISRDCKLKIKSALDAGLDEQGAKDFLGDHRQMFISHVIATQIDGGDSINDVVFSTYRSPKDCSEKRHCAASDPTERDAARASCDSWKALDILKRSIQRLTQTQHYTHVVVVAMGWNTVQEEAVRNVNSIATQLKAAVGSGFKPVFIAVTWPSQWNNRWLDPAVKLVSFPVKAHDADEVGLTWLGVLLHETLPDSRLNIPVVAIGHSFGSRAMSTASCIGPIIYEDTPARQRQTIHTLVNLEGAFQASRLLGGQENKLRYPRHCTNVEMNVLTASVHDDAVRKAFWGYFTGFYAGDIRSWHKECAAPLELSCGSVDASGRINVVTEGTAAGIVYLDANELITQNAYLTGGGAHSDIYRLEHGVLLSNVIKRKLGLSPP